MNFAKGGDGEPSLLSFDDARTLFHEFGHALARDAVGRDLSGPVRDPRRRRLRRISLAALRALARAAGDAPPLRASTTRPASRCPRRCSTSSSAARRFNQGFATVEYTASALVDLKLHLDPAPDDVDVVAFERDELERIGMPEAIAMRHRTPHFQHVFSGGYSAAYYSYLWSEILDADGFEAFEEAGDIFDPGGRAPPARFRLCGRRQPRLRGGLSRLPRPGPRRGAVPQARARIAAKSLENKQSCRSRRWLLTLERLASIGSRSRPCLPCARPFVLRLDRRRSGGAPPARRAALGRDAIVPTAPRRRSESALTMSRWAWLPPIRWAS